MLGTKTTDRHQFLYVDTPGVHGDEPKAINRYMNRSARTVIRDVDVVVFVLDRTDWQADDQLVADLAARHKENLLVVINKIDLIKDKGTLLPYLEKLQKRFSESALVPLSAEDGDNVERLEQLIAERLPPGPPLFLKIKSLTVVPGFWWQKFLEKNHAPVGRGSTLLSND